MDVTVVSPEGRYLWLDVGVSIDPTGAETTKRRRYTDAAASCDAKFNALCFSIEGKATRDTARALSSIALEFGVNGTRMLATVMAAITMGNGLAVSKAEAFFRMVSFPPFTGMSHAVSHPVETIVPVNLPEVGPLRDDAQRDTDARAELLGTLEHELTTHTDDAEGDALADLHSRRRPMAIQTILISKFRPVQGAWTAKKSQTDHLVRPPSGRPVGPMDEAGGDQSDYRIIIDEEESPAQDLVLPTSPLAGDCFKSLS
jgi:hypothetical protein